MKSIIFSILSLIFLTSPFIDLQSASFGGKERKYTLKSPDKTYEINISINDRISYSIKAGSDMILSPSTISMTIAQDDCTTPLILGNCPTVHSSKASSHSMMIESPFYRKSAIEDKYNQLEIKFREGFSLEFRSYNNGVAYRFRTSLRDSVNIMDEKAEFNFDNDYKCLIPYSPDTEQPFQISFESLYDTTSISNFKSERYAFLPTLVALNSQRKILIAESDLESYPGMFITHSKNNNYGFISAFSHIPLETYVSPTRCQEHIKSYSDVMARVSGTRTFPWRIIAISEDDTQLPVNDLVYLLGSPQRTDDISWIRPGKVAWDWWNDWGITGVDFPVGINTQTYKYIIDFASANGLEYIILDEGWSKPSKGDILSVIPEIDLKEIVEYGKSKNVGVILWTVAFVLDNKLEEASRKYSDMGIKGFKIDFINRDDQEAVKMIYRILDVTSKYHLVVDYHGMYKPTGLNRTYPNLLNYEGVWGLEQMKWSDKDQVTYNVTFPYIRMMAGPVDYTQGAMRNATKNDFYPLWSNPSSQGTRAHQVATYIVFDSPLVMLADSPTAYMKEQETTDFIKDIPTVWDETRILSGEVGQYIVTARRKGTDWYIGALTGWDQRDLNIDISFINTPAKTITIFQDGLNAHRNGADYKIKTISFNDSLRIHLSPGGGCAIKIKQ
jgi:alpha-glucosidase